MADDNGGGGGGGNPGGNKNCVIGKRVIVVDRGLITTIVGHGNQGFLILENCETKARAGDLIFLTDGLSDEEVAELYSYFSAKKKRYQKTIMPKFAKLAVTEIEPAGEGKWIEKEGDGEAVLDRIKHNRVVTRPGGLQYCVCCGGEVEEDMTVDPTGEDDAEEDGGEEEGEGEDGDAEKEGQGATNGECNAGVEREGSAARGTGTGANDGEGDDVLLVGDGGTTEEFQRIMSESKGDAKAFRKAVRTNVASVNTEVRQEVNDLTAKYRREVAEKEALLKESAETYAAKAAAFLIDQDGDLAPQFEKMKSRNKEIEKRKEKVNELDGEKEKGWDAIRAVYNEQIEGLQGELGEARNEIEGVYRENKRRCLARGKGETPEGVKAVAKSFFDEHVVDPATKLAYE